jgi:hypothetical protein
VFTARYALIPYIKQIHFVFKGLNCLYSNAEYLMISGFESDNKKDGSQENFVMRSCFFLWLCISIVKFLFLPFLALFRMPFAFSAAWRAGCATCKPSFSLAHLQHRLYAIKPRAFSGSESEVLFVFCTKLNGDRVLTYLCSYSYSCCFFVASQFTKQCLRQHVFLQCTDFVSSSTNNLI